MNWKDLIDSPNLSRKAVIVLIAIVAIVTIIPASPAGGEPLDPQLVRCVIIAIVAITLVGLSGIAAQTMLDWKWPKGYEVNKPATEPTEITEVKKPEA